MLIAPHHSATKQPTHLATLETHVAFARFFADAAAWSMDTETEADLDAFALFIDVATSLDHPPFDSWAPSFLAHFTLAVEKYCISHNIFEPSDTAQQLLYFHMFLDESGWRNTHVDREATANAHVSLIAA